jgi:hypothetical protein
VLTRIGIKNSLLAAERTVVLLVVLHDDQAPDAESMVAAKFYRPPLNLHAHGTRVVVYLRNVREDLCVYFCADGFGEMFGELWVFYLTGECRFYA